MIRIHALALLVASTLLGSFDATVFAQGSRGQAAPRSPRASRYQPNRPTVSPYLNLFRRDGSPTTNYHTLVRPQLRQQDFNRRQEATSRQLEQSVEQTQRQLSVPLVAPTGTGARHGDYSHYYSGLSK
jgi:hypothetical protein